MLIMLGRLRLDFKLNPEIKIRVMKKRKGKPNQQRSNKKLTDRKDQ